MFNLYRVRLLVDDGIRLEYHALGVEIKGITANRAVLLVCFTGTLWGG